MERSLAARTSKKYDALVVGAGPAGSAAALCLARGGASVALVDKADFPRDKACGDLVGPRGLKVLADLGICLPAALEVGDMLVSGPTGGHVVLPCAEGIDYPGHGIAIRRSLLDDVLRTAALDAGAEPFVGRAGEPLTTDGSNAPTAIEGFVVSGPHPGVPGGELEIRADVVIGADGATSRVAAASGLVDPERSLWAFATRSYVDAEIDIPTICWWDAKPWDAFPGYGWAFPGGGGSANVGLGMALLGSRRRAAGVTRLMAVFSKKLGGLAPPLGGWLRMGMVGVRPSEGRVLLVGDAAGLVNPLQGEGIAPALWSGCAGAQAFLTDPGEAAAAYSACLVGRFEPYYRVARELHLALVGRSRLAAVLERALTSRPLRELVAGAWAIFWNDLIEGASQSRASSLASALSYLLGVMVSARDEGGASGPPATRVPSL
jgi:geranylgeranyl reductase family protein